jgi:hypothetical protein
MQNLITNLPSDASNEPSDTTVALRVTRAERERVLRLAKAYDRTLSSEIRRAIRFYLTNFDLADRLLREQSVIPRSAPEEGLQ